MKSAKMRARFQAAEEVDGTHSSASAASLSAGDARIPRAVWLDARLAVVFSTLSFSLWSRPARAGSLAPVREGVAGVLPGSQTDNGIAPVAFATSVFCACSYSLGDKCRRSMHGAIAYLGVLAVGTSFATTRPETDHESSGAHLA